MTTWQINLMRDSGESSILNSSSLTVLDQWRKERHRSNVVEDFVKEKWGRGRPRQFTEERNQMEKLAFTLPRET